MLLNKFGGVLNFQTQMKLAVKICALVCFLVALCLGSLAAYSDPVNLATRFLFPALIFAIGAMWLAIISTEMDD